jgi:hypothetical protein
MKHVSFNDETQIFIIYNREYIMENNLKHELWWREIDYYNFRLQRIEEDIFLFQFSDIFNCDY